MGGQPQRSRRRHNILAGTHEELRLQLHGEVLQLKAHGARRQVQFFAGPRHSAVIDDPEKDFQLTKIHDFSLRIYIIRTF